MKANHLQLMNDTLSFLPFTVPENILTRVFQDNKTIAKDVKSGGIGDTEEREMLLQAVLKEMSLPNWPIHGMDDESWPQFFKQLRNKSQELQIDMKTVEIEEQKRLDSIKPRHNVKVKNDLSSVDFSNYSFEN